jgi:hypothetical protein
LVKALLVISLTCDNLENRTYVNPKQKISKDSINKRLLVERIMKGVLQANSRGSYLKNRFNSPQPQDNHIMLPSFEKDRGKRKISKMGGFGGVFSANNLQQLISPKPKVPLQKRIIDSRRLSSISPKAQVGIKMPISKKQTMGVQKFNIFEKSGTKVFSLA